MGVARGTRRTPSPAFALERDGRTLAEAETEALAIERALRLRATSGGGPIAIRNRRTGAVVTVPAPRLV